MTKIIGYLIGALVLLTMIWLLITSSEWLCKLFGWGIVGCIVFAIGYKIWDEING